MTERSSAESITVVVVDDHPVVRAGVRGLLETAGDIAVVGDAASAAEALAVTRHRRPSVVVTDLRLGTGGDGVDVAAAVRALPDPPAVVVLTTYDDDSDIVRAVEAGAAGYLLKDAPPATIVQAVRDAAAGRPVLAADLAVRVLKRLREPRPDLSERELDVLRLVAQGLSNRDIARTLGLGEATVKTHLVHAYAKLAVDNRTAAAVRARELGLVP